MGEHDIVAVLGANGAGKTTLLKSISRIQTIKGGTIAYKGKDLATVPAFRLAGLGIAHVPEGRHVFATLTTEENLNMGAYGVRNMPAAMVKRSLTGNGHASKQQVQRAIQSFCRLPAPPEPPDVADALAIALCAARKFPPRA